MARGAKRLRCTATPAALCGLFVAVLLTACADAKPNPPNTVSSYGALVNAAAAGGSYTVTSTITWPASGTLSLSNVNLALTGACSPSPCVLNANALGGHFRVFAGANLSLTSLSVVNSLLVASNDDCYSFNASLRLPACGAVTVVGGSFAATNTIFSDNIVKTNGGSTGARLRELQRGTRSLRLTRTRLSRQLGALPSPSTSLRAQLESLSQSEVVSFRATASIPSGPEHRGQAAAQ